MAGWIKISREIVNHWLWQDAERLKWWMDLLFLAAWEEKKQLVGKQLVVLQKGQLIASLSFLCNRWGRSRTMVEPFLNLLIAEEMIEKSVSKNISIITIVNYEKFQALNGAYLEADLKGTNSSDCGTQPILSDAHLDADIEAHLDAHLDATNKEYKEIENNNYTYNSAREKKFIEDLKDEKSRGWQELIAMRHHLESVEIVCKWLDTFALDIQCRQIKHQDLNDARRHFSDWLKYELSHEQKQKNNETDRPNKQNQRRSTETSSTSWKDYEGTF